MTISTAALRDTVLQWSTGLLATMLGAQMLIVPHQLSTPAYDLVRPHIGLWGGTMLLAGILMLVVAATGRSRWLVLTAHVGLGALLLLLGTVFAATGGWFGGTIFAVLGVATVVAPAVCRAPRTVAGASDLFTIAIGDAFLLIGIIVLAMPGLFAAPAFDWMRPYERWYGASLVVIGGAVVATQLYARARWWQRWLASLLLVAVVVAPMVARSLAQQLWTGITIYGLLAVTLVAAPLLGPVLERIDPRSLRTRLAVTLAVSSALALILVVTVDTNREQTSPEPPLHIAAVSLSSG